VSTYRKKLIEVALPLEEINIASAREKSIRHGHPSTLHLWWARRPLATCRAVLFSSIIDDPGEAGVPQGLLDRIDALPLGVKYRHLAAEEPLDEVGNLFPTEDAEREKATRKRRYQLFTFIERLVQWENSNDEDTLNVAHDLINAACVPECPPDTDVIETIFVEALKFNGYQEFGDEECSESSNRVAASFRATGRLDVSLRELRNCLFFTQRVWRWQGDDIPEDIPLIHALYGEIRRRWSEVEPNLPPVLDPFCGGGSIPLEAQRLKLEAHGSDLNPVAVVISKAMIEIPPKFFSHPAINPEARENGLGVWTGAQGLADDVRYFGQWLRDEAHNRIGHLYPNVRVTSEMALHRPDLAGVVGNELTVIAWLWARTAKCPNPACGADAPLVRSFALGTKKHKEAWVVPVPRRDGNVGVEFAVRVGQPALDERLGIEAGTCAVVDVDAGGKRLKKLKKVKATFLCASCGVGVLKGEAIDEQANSVGLGIQPLAVVAEGQRGRFYLPFDQDQAEGIAATRQCLQLISEGALPTEPCRGTFASNAQGRIYGFKLFKDYFTDRQLVALTTFSDLIRESRVKVEAEAKSAGFDAAFASAYANAISTYLAFAMDRSADRGSTICSWDSSPKMEALRNTYARQAIPMTWDFAEGNPFSTSTGNLLNNVDWVAKAVALLPASGFGFAEQADAIRPTEHKYLFSTDPPYFDNIGYADLSDFFYVWLRRSIGEIYPDIFATLVSPKADELIATPYRHQGSKEKATAFFEAGLRAVFRRMYSQGLSSYPTTIYYAFKQSESEGDEESGGSETASTGWESMLQGLVDSGFAINGTWPTRTELANRTIASGTNALASCIVLVCRPRPENSDSVTRREFLAMLRAELRPALIKLTQGNLAPVDLAQASIGPGMAVFSRFASVLEADGKPMKVRTALGLINQGLEEALSEQEGWYDSQTRWAVTWFRQHGFQEGPYGEAETLATAKDTPVGTLSEAGIIRSGGGKVKLLPRDELVYSYDPSSAKKATIWEATQHLVRSLDQHGELGAAKLMRRFRETRQDLDIDRARELAYRLYAICDQKRWTQEARVYNALVLSWSDIEAVSQSDAAIWNAVGEGANLFS